MARRRAVTGKIALVAAAAFGLTACGGGTDSGGPVTSIRVLDYYNNEPERTVYERVLGECGQQAGVTIDREVVPGDSLIPKVLQQASSRTLPDVLMLDNPDLQQIAETGALVPIADFGLSAEGYADGIVSANTHDGTLYGLQPVTNSLGLFYNVDILNAAGVTPPTTWDELRTAAAALTLGDRYGVAFSAVADYEGAWQFLPFVWSNGGDETNLASPPVAQALQLWVDLVQSGSAPESVLNWGQADVRDQFATGNVAMMINGPWQFPALDEVAGLHYAVVPIPTPQAGGTVVAPLGGETWTIPQTEEPARQAKAAEIIKCLNTDQQQLSLSAERSTVPTRTALRDQFVAQQPRMQAFTDLVADARARTGKLGTEWPAAAIRIYTAVQTAITGGATPEQALREAQSG